MMSSWKVEGTLLVGSKMHQEAVSLVGRHLPMSRARTRDAASVAISAACLVLVVLVAATYRSSQRHALLQVLRVKAVPAQRELENFEVRAAVGRDWSNSWSVARHSYAANLSLKFNREQVDLDGKIIAREPNGDIIQMDVPGVQVRMLAFITFTHAQQHDMHMQINSYASTFAHTRNHTVSLSAVSLFPSHSLSFSRSLFLSLSIAIPVSHPHSLSLSLFFSRTQTLSHTLSVSLTHSPSLSLSLSLFLPMCVCDPLSLPLSLS